jgi:hypothetical protein
VDISIVKAQTGPHRAVAVRPGGDIAQFAVYDYGSLPPHDLVHFVVEDELGIEFGFWGLLAAGANLEAVQTYGARDARRVRHVKDPLVQAHAEELLNAERLVAGFSDLPGTESDPELDAATAARIRARLDDCNRRWQATPAGEVFRLQWPSGGARAE